MLLDLGRPEEGLQSFEAALKVDDGFEAAKEGRKLAQQKIGAAPKGELKKWISAAL